MKITTTVVLFAGLTAMPVLAQQPAHHAGMDHSKMMATAANPDAPGEMKMHERMMSAMGADASEIWVRKMIEHHRGAIEMSRTAITQAKDAQVKEMAQRTATMQEKGDWRAAELAEGARQKAAVPTERWTAGLQLAGSGLTAYR